MQLIQTGKSWIVAALLGAGLTGVGMSLADRGFSVAALNEVPPAETEHARELSEGFRHIAREVLPSIVSIETRGKATQVTSNMQLPFDENSPFGELFRNDPRLRDFFRNPPEQRQRPAQRGMGSGFIIDESGVVMTNSHVVQNAEEVKVRLQDGREFIARDIRTDPRTDVAVIRIDADNLDAIPLGDSDKSAIGDWVLAIGSPFGLDLTVTAGIISAKDRGPGIAERESFLQTDAAINPGNSGGPLVNMAGEVIGINTAISTRSGGYDGVGFTIPINMAKWVADQLTKHGEVRRAYLGVSIQPVTADLAEQFGATVGEGVIVNQVMADSPAAEAKLEPGDVVVKFAGKKVDSPRDLQGIVEQLEVDEPHEMTILRNGQESKLSVTLRQMPEDYTRSALRSQRQNGSQQPEEQEFNELGVEVQELTRETARQLGLDEPRGVLVKSVKDGSPAELAGLRAGDVIEEIGRQKVNSTEEFEEALENVSLKEGVVMLVRSGGVSRFLSVQIR